MITFRVSSSISNFKDKIAKRYRFSEWHWWKSRDSQCIFFGMYHIGDYFRLFWHRGQRTIFWCGSDIVNLKNSWIWKRILPKLNVDHICENDVEDFALWDLGIKAKIKPQFFGGIEEFPISYIQSSRPKVWVTYHPDREKEYGIDTVRKLETDLPEIKFYAFDGMIPEAVMNGIVKGFQAHLRLNEFDGFGDSLAKSVLMGQWPISRIWYPGITSYTNYQELVMHLKQLKDKNQPNYAASEYWRKRLSKSIT